MAAENFLSGFFNSALNLLNYTTYFEMKTRAGTIGKKGRRAFSRPASAFDRSDPSDRP